MGAQLSLGIEVINAACAGAALLTLVLVVRRPKAAARAGAPGARRVALEPCEGCVVSGVGLGLPGTGRKVFCGANAAALLRGECLIEPLGDDQADALLARRVVQLQKSKDRGPTKVPITRREQTVGVSARLGDFDLSAEYGVPKALAQTMGEATQIAVAAGLEVCLALRGVERLQGKAPQRFNPYFGLTREAAARKLLLPADLLAEEMDSTQ